MPGRQSDAERTYGLAVSKGNHLAHNNVAILLGDMGNFGAAELVGALVLVTQSRGAIWV